MAMPSEATSLTLTDMGNGVIKADWTNGTNPNLAHWKLSVDGITVSATLSPSATTLSVYGQTAGSHTVLLQGVGSGGELTTGLSQSITVTGAHALNPTGLVLTQTDDNTVQAVWPVVQDINRSAYVLTLDSDTPVTVSNNGSISPAPGATLSHVFTGVANGFHTVYLKAVGPVSGMDSGSTSQSLTVVSFPSTPTNFTATGDGYGNIVFTWDVTDSDNVYNYVITDTDTSDQIYADPTARSYTGTGFAVGDHNFTLVAHGDIDTSAQYASATVPNYHTADPGTNKADLRDRVRSLTDMQDNLILTDAEIDAFVNESYRTILNKQPWSFLIFELTGVVGDGQTLVTNLMADPFLVNPEVDKLIEAWTTSPGLYRLELITVANRSRVASDSKFNSARYAQVIRNGYGLNEVHVYPGTSGETQVRLRVRVKAPKLVADSDVPLLPEEWRYIIAYRAAASVLEREADDTGRIASYLQHVNQDLEDMRTTLTASIQQNTVYNSRRSVRRWH